jgi:hypothetical protein
MSQAHTGDRICAACRSARLSRYNPEPLCGPCTRTARQTKGIIPASETPNPYAKPWPAWTWAR